MFAISGDCPWLAENPTNGTIPAGSYQDVWIWVDATVLAPGTYEGNLVLNSNDPVESSLSILNPTFGIPKGQHQREVYLSLS